MHGPNFDDHPICKAAEFIGSTLGGLAGRYDRIRGVTYRPALERVIDRTQQRVRSEPHQPTADAIGALGEIARVEAD